jgi:hypothetical protein
MTSLKQLNTPKLASRQRPYEANSDSSSGHLKVIRDGFSMPEADYQMIAQIQAICMAGGLSATKSGVLRAALHALLQLSSVDRIELFQALDPVKTGRPRSSKLTT